MLLLKLIKFLHINTTNFKAILCFFPANHFYLVALPSILIHDLNVKLKNYLKLKKMYDLKLMKGFKQKYNELENT